MGDVDIIKNILEELRAMRNKEPVYTELRSHYNTACDRLDVLLSKLIERDKKPSSIQLKG